MDTREYNGTFWPSISAMLLTFVGTLTAYCLKSKCTEINYNKLIELYKINEMKDFQPYQELRKLVNTVNRTYNPQKSPGKPWKVKGHKINKDVYGQNGIIDLENITGDRHPKSVLKFHQNVDKLHPTQKPLEL